LYQKVGAGGVWFKCKNQKFTRIFSPVRILGRVLILKMATKMR